MEKSPSYEIVMLGNSAVGKTSMLAALASELESYNAGQDLKLEPSRREFKLLGDQLLQLQEQIAGKSPITTLNLPYHGSQGFRDHPFDFSLKSETKCRVSFVDTEGRFTGDLSSEKLIEKVHHALGVFVVIDAAVLMECTISKNEQWNAPKMVKELLKKGFFTEDGAHPEFVFFILTKCEKYLRERRFFMKKYYPKRRGLETKFRETYKGMIEMLQQIPGLRLDMLGIQTMGCVTFAGLSPETNLPFFKVNRRAKFVTRDCAYPLALLMEELVRRLEREMSVWDKLKRWFGFCEDLRKYQRNLSRKLDHPILHVNLSKEEN